MNGNTDWFNDGKSRSAFANSQSTHSDISRYQAFIILFSNREVVECNSFNLQKQRVISLMDWPHSQIFQCTFVYIFTIQSKFKKKKNLLQCREKIFLQVVGEGWRVSSSNRIFDHSSPVLFAISHNSVKIAFVSGGLRNK